MTVVSRTDNLVTRTRVIFGDTDAGGIVYHLRYLEMAERGRNELTRSLGLDVGKLFAEDGYGLALRSCDLKFHTPALFDDLLTIHTHISKLRAASSVWTTKIKRGPTEICTVHAEIICMDRAAHRPEMFPDHVAAAFQADASNKNQPTKKETL
jgi:tol-pal system-associated acyl-CoA thioesterase